MKGLTIKQQDILDYIENFIEAEGMSPTVYEIAEHFSIKPATSFAHMQALQKKGYISRSSKARSLTLTKQNTRSKLPRHSSFSLSIPILGRISAGMALSAEEQYEETIEFDASKVPGGANKKLFGLRINGESMRDAGILDGDIIIVRQVERIKNGDIAVVNIDGETTVKYFFLNQDQVELRPDNLEFSSQFYPKEMVEIQGEVIALQRTF